LALFLMVPRSDDIVLALGVFDQYLIV